MLNKLKIAYRTKRVKLVLYIREFLNETFENDGHISFCQSYEKPVSIDQRGQGLDLKLFVFR